MVPMKRAAIHQVVTSSADDDDDSYSEKKAGAHAASTLDEDDDDDSTVVLQGDYQSTLHSSQGEKHEIIATELGDNDVVSARGNRFAQHPGSVKFHTLVKEAAASFEKAEPRSNERKRILYDIVDKVNDRKGRFLSPISAYYSWQAKEWELLPRAVAYQRTATAMHNYFSRTKSARSCTQHARESTVSSSSGAASLEVGTGSRQPKRPRRDSEFTKPTEKLLLSTADASKAHHCSNQQENASAAAEDESTQTSTLAAVDQTLSTTGKDNGNGGLVNDETESFKSAECATADTAATRSPITLPDRACILTMPPGSNANASVRPWIWSDSVRAAAAATASDREVDGGKLIAQKVVAEVATTTSAAAATTASTTPPAASTTPPAASIALSAATTTTTTTASNLGSGLVVAAAAATTLGLKTPEVSPVGSTLKLPPNGSTRSELRMTLGATTGSKAAPEANIPVLPGVMHTESIASDKLVHKWKSGLPATVEKPESSAAATAAGAAKKPTPTAAANGSSSSSSPQTSTLPTTGHDVASKGVANSSGTTIQPSVISTNASTIAAATTTAASLPVATLTDDNQSSVGKAAAAAGTAIATPTTLTGSTSLDTLPSLDECVELMVQEARQVAITNTQLISSHASRYEQVRALSADPLVQLGIPDSAKPMEAIPQPSSYAPNEWLDWFSKLDQQNKQLLDSEGDLDSYLGTLNEHKKGVEAMVMKLVEAKRSELAQQLNVPRLAMGKLLVAMSMETPGPGIASASSTVSAPEPDGATARYSLDECVELAKKEAVLISKNTDRLTKQHCTLRDAINAHLQAMGESETLPRVKPIDRPSSNDGWFSWFGKLDRFNGELEQTIHQDELKLERCEQVAQLDEETAALEKQAREMAKALEARKKATRAAVLGQQSVAESSHVFDV